MGKFDTTERFGAHDFLQVVFTSQMSKNKNKGNIGHYKYKGPHSSLDEGVHHDNDPTKRFEEHDFL